MRRASPILVLLLLSLAPSPSRAETPFQLRVNVAIDKGVEWLRGRCGTDGSFGLIGGEVNYSGGSEVYRYPHGCTSLALLTLLKCGVPPDDPAVKQGFLYLERKGRIPKSTYEIAALMLAIEARTNQVKRERKLEAVRRMQAKPGERVDVRIKLPRKDHAWMTDLTKALVDRWDEGAWRYGLPNPVPGGDHDMSNTQFAMLALHTASRCGVKIPNRVVLGTILWTLDQQQANGPDHARYVPKTSDREYAPPIDKARGWAYIKGASVSGEAMATGTMTTGGILVLITGGTILEKQAPRMLKRVVSRLDRGVLDGIAWLDKHWRVDSNPPGRKRYALMYLYGLERVGDIRRTHLIGGHDWYREGADYLLDQQVSDGRWHRTDTNEPRNLLNTCFALLFLEKASLLVTTGD